MINTVTKRDGSVEKFDSDKLNKWMTWASEECGVSWSDVVFKAIRKVYDGVSTDQIQQALIDACIEYKTEAHSKMAARILVGMIYKEAFGDFSIPHLPEFYLEMVDRGYWADMGYSYEELVELDKAIDHTVDFTYSYATLKQYYDKYAMKAYGGLLESPQMTLMGIAMSNMADEPDRVESVLSAYADLLGLKINLPTSTLTLERTPHLPAPSCCVISGDDTVDSIGAANHVAYKMTATSAGIGVELRTRAPKDPVKGGKIEHGGKHGYYSLLSRAVKANSQMTRGGSATVTFHCLDPEIGKLLTLKQQRTDPTYRIDTLDYSFAVNNLFLRKVAKGEDWMTVSPANAPELWDASYAGDEELFEQEYNRVAESKVKKTFVKARDIFGAWVRARGDTGRVYITFLDNVNRHTPFVDEIRLSNLCQEIMLPTAGFSNVDQLFREDGGDGEVALCNLAAICVNNVSDEDYEEVAYNALKIVDNTIEKGIYPFPAIELSAKSRRSAGIGITGLATHLAKKGLTYDSLEGRNEIHRIAERHSYWLHKASVRLAKERGCCAWMGFTKYVNGWLPIDTYSKAVDEHHTASLRYDWEGLRQEVLEHGVRFSVLESCMPTESSSLFTNSTNGVYPVRQTEIFKNSRRGMVYFRAPDLDTCFYQNAYDIDHLDMVKVYAILQKFMGQGISADFWTTLDGESTKLSMKDMLQRVLLAAKLGMKTFYYEVFQTKAKQEVEIDGSDCESCKL